MSDAINRIAILLTGVALISSCETVRAPREYVIAFNGNAHTIDPQTPRYLSYLFGYREESEVEYAEHLESLFRSLEGYASQSAGPASVVDSTGAAETKIQDGDVHVLMFVNGGLNSSTETIRRATDLYPQILYDDKNSQYPIFLCWNSNLWSALFDHFFVVRRGENNPIIATLSSPLVLVEGLVRGIIHLPYNFLYYESDSSLKSLSPYEAPSTGAANSIAVTVATGQASASASGIAWDGPHTEMMDNPRRSRGLGEGWTRKIVSAIMTPLTLVGYVLVDGLGTPAWDIMDRRSRLLFEDRKDRTEGALGPAEPQGLRLFLARLAQMQSKWESDHHGQRFIVTVVSHSMGSIVANAILRNELLVDQRCNEKTPSLRIDNIVYMAAACSAADFLQSAVPYLLQHRESNVFLLTLHEKNETSESHLLGVAPRGSLLVWVDNLYSHMLTPGDQRIGTFVNMMNAQSSIPKEVRRQIHLKMFPLDPAAGKPVEHGDFTLMEFWNPSFWTPDPDNSWIP